MLPIVSFCTQVRLEIALEERMIAQEGFSTADLIISEDNDERVTYIGFSET
jgi:hypothetical protein